jgi:hypothetical protein
VRTDESGTYPHGVTPPFKGFIKRFRRKVPKVQPFQFDLFIQYHKSNIYSRKRILPKLKETFRECAEVLVVAEKTSKSWRNRKNLPSMRLPTMGSRLPRLRLLVSVSSPQQLVIRLLRRLNQKPTAPNRTNENAAPRKRRRDPRNARASQQRLPRRKTRRRAVLRSLLPHLRGYASAFREAARASISTALSTKSPPHSKLPRRPMPLLYPRLHSSCLAGQACLKEALA